MIMLQGSPNSVLFSRAFAAGRGHVGGLWAATFAVGGAAERRDNALVNEPPRAPPTAQLTSLLA